MLANDAISDATGFSDTRVARYWPVIVSALKAEGIGSDPVLVAAAGTLRAELGSNFAPLSEFYTGDPYTYFENKYGASTRVGKVLGNTKAGDGYRYRGRGFIQLTGRSNYTAYGKRLGLPLADNPDLALDAHNAARIFAAYFHDRGVAAAAERGDWRAVRKLVNGGYNGWDAFIGVVNKLGGAAAAGAMGSLALIAVAGMVFLSRKGG